MDGHLAPVGSSCELTGLVRDRVRGALLAPQGVAEADQGDADRNGEQPLDELRQQRGCEGGDGADGEQRCSPPGENSGPEEGDAEDDAADDVGDAGLDDDLQRADVADRVPLVATAKTSLTKPG